MGDILSKASTSEFFPLCLRDSEDENSKQGYLWTSPFFQIPPNHPSYMLKPPVESPPNFPVVSQESSGEDSDSPIRKKLENCCLKHTQSNPVSCRVFPRCNHQLDQFNSNNYDHPSSYGEHKRRFCRSAPDRTDQRKKTQSRRSSSPHPCLSMMKTLDKSSLSIIHKTLDKSSLSLIKKDKENKNVVAECQLGEQVFAEYQMVQVIGQGGFSDVLLAKHKLTGNTFAIKRLCKKMILQRKQVQHTFAERNILETCHHPFIVKMHIAFQTRDHLHFVLDYCPGGELFFHLNKIGRFKESDAVFYGAEVVLALKYLHDKGIVYRDLKPENVLLARNGHIRLADFGIAKQCPSDRTYTFCGSPDYIAPEILHSAYRQNGSKHKHSNNYGYENNDEYGKESGYGKGYGKAVDFWSLGCFLYEILTGLPPFHSNNKCSTYEKIQFREVTYPNYLSDKTKHLLSRLLQKDPNKRIGLSRIMQHPFFEEVDWNSLLLQRHQPPFIPKLENCSDTRNFDTEFTRHPFQYRNDKVITNVQEDDVRHANDFANFSWKIINNF